jgi:hypothetical protein
MTFPTPYTVLTEAYSAGSYDAHGNPVDSWAAPVQQRVIGWYVPVAIEPKVAGRDAVVVDLALMVPPDFIIGPLDRVTVAGNSFEVIGYPEDYTHGPFGFNPGLVVNLKRVEG